MRISPKRILYVCVAMVLGLGAARTTPTLKLASTTFSSAEKQAIIDVAPGVHGVWTGLSYAYVVQCDAAKAPLLVDAGSDPRALALTQFLATRGIEADAIEHILMTHGHLDHVAGSGAFAHAVMYINEADGALARGDQTPDGWLLKGVRRLSPRPVRHLSQRFVLAGTTLHVAGCAAIAHAAFGHTEGSLAWQLDDTLFVGDALRPLRDSYGRIDSTQPLSVFGAGFDAWPGQSLFSSARFFQTPCRRAAGGHDGVWGLSMAMLNPAARGFAKDI